ncbi:MAG: polyprenyl synthetase family protein [Planctomycetes bacterium]|nr:polyprenyl synthetase family protein [Planctomycetota bacterium]
MTHPAHADDDWFAALRERVNGRLRAYVERLECPTRLREAIGYSLLAGGKRLRPILALSAAEACGGETALEAAFPAACAVEMIHTYSLIHDDLPAMDDDDLRRGKPTNHVVFGEAGAILAGDALLTLAFEVLARDVQPPEVAAACCADLARASGAEGMVGGQSADLEAESTAEPSLEQLEAIHRRKTGALLSSALTLGGRIGGAERGTLRGLERYGQAVGLAFQIADDLLDLTGETDRMGKGVRKDADHGKLTYPALLGVEASRAKARELIDEACGALAPLGERSRRLESLAQFVLERDH